MRLNFQKCCLGLTAYACCMPLNLFGASSPLLENPESLWEISKTHLKDPLGWPSIWQVSPQAADAIEHAPITNPVQQTNLAGVKSMHGVRNFINDEWRKSPSHRTQGYLQKVGALEIKDNEPLPPADGQAQMPTAVPGEPLKHYMSQAVLLGTPFLAETGASSNALPHESSLRYSASNESGILQLFDEVIISAGKELGVKPGDLYRTYNVGSNYHSITNGHNLGRIIETNGIVEIVRVGPKTSVGRLIRCFGTISQNARACPLGNPIDIVATGYTPVTSGKLSARVVWLNEEQFPQPFSYAIVDRGTAKGYKVGDMVLFFNQVDGRMTDKVLANGIVVNIQEKSSTILIKDLYPGILNRGDYTVIVQTTVM